MEAMTLNLQSEIKGKMNKTKEISLDIELKTYRKDLNEIRRVINLQQTQKKEYETIYTLYNTNLSELKIKKRSLTTKIQSLEKDLDLNSTAFNSILLSVVNALIKRKKRAD